MFVVVRRATGAEIWFLSIMLAMRRTEVCARSFGTVGALGILGDSGESAVRLLRSVKARAMDILPDCAKDAAWTTDRVW